MHRAEKRTNFAGASRIKQEKRGRLKLRRLDPRKETMSEEDLHELGSGGGSIAKAIDKRPEFKTGKRIRLGGKRKRQTQRLVLSIAAEGKRILGYSFS